MTELVGFAAVFGRKGERDVQLVSHRAEMQISTVCERNGNKKHLARLHSRLQAPCKHGGLNPHLNSELRNLHPPLTAASKALGRLSRSFDIRLSLINGTRQVMSDRPRGNVYVAQGNAERRELMVIGSELIRLRVKLRRDRELRVRAKQKRRSTLFAIFALSFFELSTKPSTYRLF